MASDKSLKMELSKVKVLKVPDDERRKPRKKIPQFRFTIDDGDVLREYDPTHPMTLLFSHGDSLVVGIMKTLEPYEVQSLSDDKVYFEIDGKFKMDEDKFYSVTFIPNDVSLSHGYEAIKNIRKYKLEEYFRNFDQEPDPLSSIDLTDTVEITKPKSLQSSNDVVEILSDSSDSPDNSLTESSNRIETIGTSYPSLAQSNGFGPIGAGKYQKIADLYSKPSTSHFQWANPSLASNEEQMIAVKKIVNGKFRPFPFIVFGPPGECLSSW